MSDNSNPSPALSEQVMRAYDGIAEAGLVQADLADQKAELARQEALDEKGAQIASIMGVDAEPGDPNVRQSASDIETFGIKTVEMMTEFLATLRLMMSKRGELRGLTPQGMQERIKKHGEFVFGPRLRGEG